MVKFDWQLLITIANSSEQLAHQHCDIPSQCCNIARKTTSGLALKTLPGSVEFCRFLDLKFQNFPPNILNH